MILLPAASTPMPIEVQRLRKFEMLLAAEVVDLKALREHGELRHKLCKAEAANLLLAVRHKSVGVDLAREARDQPRARRGAGERRARGGVSDRGSARTAARGAERGGCGVSGGGAVLRGHGARATAAARPAHAPTTAARCPAKILLWPQRKHHLFVVSIFLSGRFNVAI